MAEYRVHQWINVASQEPAYTVQKRVSPRKWANCTDTGEGKFFKSRENAENWMRELSTVPEERTGNCSECDVDMPCNWGKTPCLAKGKSEGS